MRKPVYLIASLALLVTSLTQAGPSPSPPLQPPAISALIKPERLKKVLQDRDILTSANLDGDHYSFHASMLVHSGLERTRRILTQYSLYSKLISYVDRTDYSPVTHILDLQGGIWMFRMRSWIRFQERGDRWIHYSIVGGHFTGLEGDIFFEAQGEKGTLVYFDGSQTAKEFPPKFVIERGAEIVFGFTAKRMRSYLESQEDQREGQREGQKDAKPDEQAIPQPRNRL